MIGFLSIQAQTQAPVEPVNWRELTPFLIDFPGWEAEGEAEGQSITMGTFSMSQAERTYSSGEKTFTINLIDGGYAPMAYAGIKMAMSMEIDTSDEYIKKLTVAGYPGVEQYDRTDKSANVFILISERFILQIEGENFDDTSDLVSVAEKIDLKGIEKLEK